MKLLNMILDLKTKHVIKGALPHIKKKKDINLYVKQILQKNQA